MLVNAPQPSKALLSIPVTGISSHTEGISIVPLICVLSVGLIIPL